MAKKKLAPKMDLMLQLIPEAEVDKVLESWKGIMSKWENIAPNPDDYDLLNPPMTTEIDGFIHDALVTLTKAGLRSSLKKLAWTAYCQFDPEYEKAWSDPKHKAAATLVQRIGESDVFLTEYRDLRAHKEDETWAIQFQHDDGQVVQRDRVFPFWGREHKLNIDTKKKATEYYRGQLKDRQIL